MTSRVRKAVLVSHVTTSVGWLGAVMSFLGLAIAGIASRDPQLVRGADLTMEVVAWFVLLPLSLASLVTGVVQSLGTRWGLLIHYWLIAKLAINLTATIVLLMYMQTVGHYADVARDISSRDDLDRLQSGSAVIHASAALLLLVIAVVLSVYKPAGMTRYGQRKQRNTGPA